MGLHHTIFPCRLARRSDNKNAFTISTYMAVVMHHNTMLQTVYPHEQLVLHVLDEKCKQDVAWTLRAWYQTVLHRFVSVACCKKTPGLCCHTSYTSDKLHHRCNYIQG